MHGPRGPLHVHQDEPGTGFGHDVRHPGITQGGDVVDDGGPGVEGGHCHLGLGRVDGDQSPCLHQPLDHGCGPVDLVRSGDGVRSGPGGLASDVDDVGSGLPQLEPVSDGRVGL